MESYNLSLLFRLGVSGSFKRFSEVFDFRVHPLLLFLPPTTVVDFVVVAKLKLVKVRSDFPIFFTKSTQAIPLRLELFTQLFEFG